MLSKEDFMGKLEKVRKLEIEKKRLVEEILEDYSFEHIPFQAENSDNLEEALQCYMHYGELPMSGNLEDFWKAYSKALGSLEGVRNG